MVEPIGDIPAAAIDRVQKASGDLPIAGAIVLGSGLGVLLDSWDPVAALGAEDIEGYPRSTVPGHAGRIALVRFGDRAALVFQGRVHFYEGYGRGEVTYAVRLAAALGATWMLLTNASGAVDPRLSPGTILVVEDHIRLLMGSTAGTGLSAGPRLRGSPYHPGRTEAAFRVLGREGLRVVRGVLAGGLGPSYETAAEVEMIRRMGGHAACMSTVVEVEEAARRGMEVAALSLVTNLATGLTSQALDHEEVVRAAKEGGLPLARGIARLLESWSGSE